MISSQKNEPKYANLGLALMLFVLGSCRPDEKSPDNTNACTLTLKPASESETVAEIRRVVYAETMPDACLKKTSEASGRALVKLAAQATSPSEQVALDELKAGQRALKFDAKTDNLKRGTFEKSFDSTLLPEWSLPWSDRPTTVTLSMYVPRSVATDAVPGSISLELRF